MNELSLAEYFGMAEALGIVATLFVILYFSRKQMQSLSADIQTNVLNDLGDKYLKMVERVMEDPSMQRVFDSENKVFMRGSILILCTVDMFACICYA